MAFGGRTYTLRVVGDVKDATGALGGMSSKLGGLGAGALGMLGGVAGVVGTQAVGAIVDFGQASVETASRVEQSVGAVDSIFKGFAGTVTDNAKAAGDTVGLSQAEYLELATTLGGQLKNAGVPLEEIAGQTDDLINQAADLAATYGGTTAEAVQALGSAIRGEADPAERYALNLKQSAVAAEAAEEGITKSGEAMTDQQRIMALMSLTTEQAADTQGAFAREGDTLAGQQQRMAAQMDNLKLTIGKALLPIVTKLFAFFNDVAVPAIKRVVDTVKKYWPVVQRVIEPIMKAIGLIIGSILARVKDFWDRYGAQIIAIAKRVFGTIGDIIKTLVSVVTGVINFVRAIFQGKWRDALNIAKDIFVNIWNGIVKFIKNFAGIIGEVVGAVGRALGNLFSGAFGKAKDTFLTIWGNITDAITGLPGKLGEVVAGVGAAALRIGKSIVNSIIGIWNGLDLEFGPYTVPSWVPGIGGKSFHISDLIPDLPYVAGGGVVRRQTAAILGESGPEAIVPLRGSGALGNTYNIWVDATATDPYETGRKIVALIRRYEQTGGAAWRGA